MTTGLHRTARRTHSFTESVIREMSRVAREHNAVNLAQGFPDFPAPELLKEAAAAAIRADVNQYAITWGASNLRHALARKYAEHYSLEVNTETEITITCGGTEAMAWVTLRRLHDADSDAAALREGSLPSDGLGRSVFCTRGVSNPRPSRGPN